MCIICIEYQKRRMDMNEVYDAANESFDKYKDEDHESEAVEETFNLIDVIRQLEEDD